jgi:hypothetical protein
MPALPQTQPPCLALVRGLRLVQGVYQLALTAVTLYSVQQETQEALRMQLP